MASLGVTPGSPTSFVVDDQSESGKCSWDRPSTSLKLGVLAGFALGLGFGFGLERTPCDPATTCNGHGVCQGDEMDPSCLCASLFQGESCDKCTFSGQYPFCEEARPVQAAEVLNDNMAAVRMVWGLRPDVQQQYAYTDSRSFAPDVPECQSFLADLCLSLIHI